MTDTGSKEKLAEAESPEGITTEPAPAPEPWTPQRVFEWNSYYDLYVAAFVVLLAFLGVANKIPAVNSGIWSLLQAGRQMVETRSPVVTDTTSIAGEGRRWVNIPWLYELSHYAIYEGAGRLAPRLEPGAPPPRVSGPREQYGAGALIAVDALVRALAAFLLLGLRRKGPGLWWTCLCVTMALGVTLSPVTFTKIITTPEGRTITSLVPWVGVQIGGIAPGASVVGPETWGLLLLAVELLLLHQATNLGKLGRLYALVPVFLLWANMDESFAFGLVILAAYAMGQSIGSRRDPSGPSARSAWITLGVCAAATFVTPSHVFGVMAGFDSILKPIAALPKALGIVEPTPGLSSSFLFSAQFGPAGLPTIVRSWRFYYLVLVGLGLASFVLNRRDFAPGRFAALLASAVLWALDYNVFMAPFALVLAATLALNGQEWYLQTYGSEGRLGAGWTVWSTGGRLVTIAVVFAAIARSVTGWGGEVGDAQFGFGFNPDDFPFESAESVRDASIEGGILNTSLTQGDAIAWKAASKRKAFVDSRSHLYPPTVMDELRNLRNDLKNDDIARWQPELDRLKVSAVMIQPSIGLPGDIAPNTYVKLLTSPNWLPFYDDGTVVIFGRVDSRAPAADVAFFKANKLDANEMAYKRPKLVAPWERPPTATWDLVDSIFQNRLLSRPQPHTAAALHWLEPSDLTPGKSYIPDPARCLMAIREARTALSLKPDDSTAFQILIVAYQRLLVQESALVAGIQPIPENLNRIAQSPSQARILKNRNRQLLAAFNFRLATLPPAKNTEDRQLKARLNQTLAQLYLQSGAIDLARDRLTLLADEAQINGMGDQFNSNLTKQLIELNQRVGQIQKQLDDQALNRQVSPIMKAGFARANGAPGIAIRELEEANDAGGNIPGVRPMLVDLYCEVGLPDKALDIIFNLNVDDPTLASGTGASATGTAAYRQGLVYFLLGNYTNACGLWQDRAILPIRSRRSLDGLGAGQLFLGGEAKAAVRNFLDLPEQVNTQAEWEFELGLAALEGGLPPEFAADHLQTALKLEPNLTVRPVIAYYLEQLGKPVPPPRTTAPAIPAKVAEPPTTPTPTPDLPTIAPAEKPELPPDVFVKDPPKP